MHRHLRITSLAALAMVLGGCSPVAGDAPSGLTDPTDMVLIKAGQFDYYPAGDFLRGGNPVGPPSRHIRFEHDFQIMKRQVSQAEYAACVSEGACKKLDKSQRGAVAPNLPVVGISWRDATAYAAWLSARTGNQYRLPSYAEWVYAAGSLYKEDIVVDGAADPNDPAQRWLIEYRQETQRKATTDATPRPFGSFGSNAEGLSDMTGNVWDWTDTCHTRQHMDQAAGALPPAENCGIRVVAGKHRSYISDFIRDPKGGACSVGVPPSNLGFRLVRDSTDKSGSAMQNLRSRLGIQ